MDAATLLHVAYALMIEGADNESIEKLDAELSNLGEPDPTEKMASILALGGEIL